MKFNKGDYIISVLPTHPNQDDSEYQTGRIIDIDTRKDNWFYLVDLDGWHQSSWYNNYAVHNSYILDVKRMRSDKLETLLKEQLPNS